MMPWSRSCDSRGHMIQEALQWSVDSYLTSGCCNLFIQVARWKALHGRARSAVYYSYAVVIRLDGFHLANQPSLLAVRPGHRPVIPRQFVLAQIPPPCVLRARLLAPVTHIPADQQQRGAAIEIRDVHQLRPGA